MPHDGIDFVDAKVIAGFGVGGHSARAEADQADAAILFRQSAHGKSYSAVLAIVSGGPRGFFAVDELQAMRDAASREGVTIAVVSAFRSFDYQKQIICL